MSVLSVSDKILILRDGRVATYGATDEVIALMRRAAEGSREPAPLRKVVYQ
jgi:ABC-type protease/lipase transport system fused ATPase/permease subunit